MCRDIHKACNSCEVQSMKQQIIFVLFCCEAYDGGYLSFTVVVFYVEFNDVTDEFNSLKYG